MIKENFRGKNLCKRRPTRPITYICTPRLPFPIGRLKGQPYGVGTSGTYRSSTHTPTYYYLGVTPRQRSSLAATYYVDSRSPSPSNSTSVLFSASSFIREQNERSATTQKDRQAERRAEGKWFRLRERLRTPLHSVRRPKILLLALGHTLPRIIIRRHF